MSIVDVQIFNREHPIRVLLVDDHHIVRSGIKREISRYEDIMVVAEAIDGTDVLPLVETHQPDVIILDINMPKVNGLDVLGQFNTLITQNPEQSLPHILILSAYCEREYVYMSFATGAKGYLLKDELSSVVVSGIYKVMRGEPAVSPNVQRILITSRHTNKNELSQRELEVLNLVARGFNDREIAKTLHIAISTVQNHITNIYSKLPSVGTRAEAVAWAWQNGIVNSKKLGSQNKKLRLPKQH